MNPLVVTVIFLAGTAVVVAALLLAYRVAYPRLPESSPLRRMLRWSIIAALRAVRIVGNLYILLGLAVIVFFGYLTIAYS